MDRTDTSTTAHSAADLERGRSKEIHATAGDDTNYIATQQTTSGQRQPVTVKKGLYKYLLLSVFCLGVFIDGESRTNGPKECWLEASS